MHLRKSPGYVYLETQLLLIQNLLNSDHPSFQGQFSSMALLCWDVLCCGTFQARDLPGKLCWRFPKQYVEMYKYRAIIFSRSKVHLYSWCKYAGGHHVFKGSLVIDSEPCWWGAKSWLCPGKLQEQALYQLSNEHTTWAISKILPKFYPNWIQLINPIYRYEGWSSLSSSRTSYIWHQVSCRRNGNTSVCGISSRRSRPEHQSICISQTTLILRSEKANDSSSLQFFFNFLMAQKKKSKLLVTFDHCCCSLVAWKTPRSRPWAVCSLWAGGRHRSLQNSWPWRSSCWSNVGPGKVGQKSGFKPTKLKKLRSLRCFLHKFSDVLRWFEYFVCYLKKTFWMSFCVGITPAVRCCSTSRRLSHIWRCWTKARRNSR